MYVYIEQDSRSVVIWTLILSGKLYSFSFYFALEWTLKNLILPNPAFMQSVSLWAATSCSVKKCMVQSAFVISPFW